MRTLAEVENYFSYHAPDDETRLTHERVNNLFLEAARLLWEIVEPKNEGSPDKTIMFRRLSDARMQANMAVACYIPTPNKASLIGSDGSTGSSETPGQTAVST